ncbi:MAG: rhodanese-like domain-containing protein [Gemmatimonadota bacterium]
MQGWLSRLLSFFLPSPPEIRPGEDVVFVDVRTPAEYARGHVAGARLIPHHEMDRRWKELRDQRKKRILVYCRTGRRSRVATEILRSRGFEKGENAGGIGGLRRAGVAMEPAG